METQNFARIISNNDVHLLWNSLQSEKGDPDHWVSINWKKTNVAVQHLRRRIFVATQRFKNAKSATEKAVALRRLRKLQEQALFSYDNLLVAIRRVTQINKGKNTPGSDNFLIKTKEDRSRLVHLIRHHVHILQWNPDPVRRMSIFKSNDKLRPIDIPTLIDRVLQAIYKTALEPEWEAYSDIGSYGFRPGRSCHDAIEKIFTTIKTPNHSLPRKCWAVETDIAGCFDNINHDYLMSKIGTFPGNNLLYRWLKAGYINKKIFHETDITTPQGGIISPLLANIALNGLEKELGVHYRTKKSENTLGFRITLSDSLPKNNQNINRRAFIRYANNFVILTESEWDAVLVKEQLSKRLKKRGLLLNLEKTHITHLTQGFDFLGFNVRIYACRVRETAKSKKVIEGYKPLIKPSAQSIAKVQDKLKTIFLAHRGKSAQLLISNINPVIRGWANYHKSVVSRKSFEKLDSFLFTRQLRFIYRLHGNKGKKWAVSRYFGTNCPSRPKDKWVFAEVEQPTKLRKKKIKSSFDLTRPYMIKFRWVPITRHPIVPNGYSPDDPAVNEFWQIRQAMGQNSNIVQRGDQKIATLQRHTCLICGLTLYNNETIEKHHIIAKKDGGLDTYDNLVFLHKVCHQQITQNSSWVFEIRQELSQVQKKGFLRNSF